MIKIYKLKYPNKETAIADLKAKGVYTEDLSFGNGIHAIVEIGVVSIDENIFADGYHFDVMSEIEIDFGTNRIFPNNPKHTFAGYEVAN